jgi:signal transduction histidine kinase
MSSHPEPTRDVTRLADNGGTAVAGPQSADRNEHLDADLAAVARISAVPMILEVVSQVTGLRLALIARVTQRSWTACAVLDRMEFGLAVGDHLDVATTLCSEVRDTHEAIIIEHASREPDFSTHPTPRMYGFESYIAVPIFRPNGEYFGNVCALDSAPAALRDAKTLTMMRLFSELISLQLTVEEEAGRDREALSNERQTAELREQFIAVLGHDLRSPLSSIIAGADILLRLPQNAAHTRALERIRSSGRRMSQLIDDIMDFARGRLGGGITLKLEAVEVAGLVNDVASEIAGAHPDRVLRVAVADAGTTRLDRSRVGQMLSNLVANAVAHSAPTEPVDICVERTGAGLAFAVISRGNPIAAGVLPRLFQPYFRAGEHRTASGLGLGLYIAAEIARAHGGSIKADSTPDGATTFTVVLPEDPGGG